MQEKIQALERWKADLEFLQNDFSCTSLNILLRDVEICEDRTPQKTYSFFWAEWWMIVFPTCSRPHSGESLAWSGGFGGVAPAWAGITTSPPLQEPSGPQSLWQNCGTNRRSNKPMKTYYGFIWWWCCISWYGISLCSEWTCKNCWMLWQRGSSLPQ